MNIEIFTSDLTANQKENFKVLVKIQSELEQIWLDSNYADPTKKQIKDVCSNYNKVKIL